MRFSWAIILIYLGFILNKLFGVKGSPSESSRIKGKHVSVFISKFNLKQRRRDCLEIARGRIGAKGDIYIIPAPQFLKQSQIHESFHSPKGARLGEYHIVDKGIKTKEENLLSGDRDFTDAFRFSMFMRMPSCFCFRCGTDLKAEEVENIVEKLVRYVCVASTDKEKIVSSLITTGKCQFSQPPEWIKLKKELFERLQRDSK